MAVTRKYRNGTVLGFECGNGHTHGSEAEALTCDPAKFAAVETAQQKEREQNRRRQVKEDGNFKLAVDAAKKLGAADADAEEVVIANGCERVLAAQAAIAGLGIGRIKAPKATKPEDQKPAA